MYQNLVFVLKIEKEVQELPQSVGVQQGKNMAPVLFLFLMSDFAETLKVEWKNAGRSVHSTIYNQREVGIWQGKPVWSSTKGRPLAHTHCPRVTPMSLR
jgi:hypothetical protein